MKTTLWRKWPRRWASVFGGTQLLVLLLLVGRTAGWWQPMELYLYDRLVAAWVGQRISPDITLVTITEEDIARFGSPLSDADLAAVLQRLIAWDARVIGVDIYRDRPLPPGEADLDRIRAEHPNIVWGFKLRDTNDTGVPPRPLPAASSNGALVDMVVDAGGVVRRGLIAASDPASGETIPTLGAAVAQAYTGETLQDIDEGAAVAVGRGRVPILTSPFGPYARVDATGYQMLLDFTGGRHAFAQIGVHQLLTNDAAASLVRGRIVLIGTDAVTVKDRFPSPLSSVGNGEPVLGVMLHAHLADQLIRAARGEATGYTALSPVLEDAFIWACGLSGTIMTLLLVRLRFVLPAVTVGAGVIATLTYLAFDAGLILPGLLGMLALLGACATGLIMLYGMGTRERFRLRQSFEHYLDPRIIQDMLEQDKLPAFGGEHREISALFTDLKEFTSFSEPMPPQQVATLLHDYFDGVCGAVLASGGLISTFLGDGILALFGAPQMQPDHADRAVEAAIRINAFAMEFRGAQLAKGIDWRETRIAIHSGPAMVGNIGTRARLHYGAIGDVLNAASRLEGLNKQIGTHITVSADTAHLCRRHRFQAIGEFVLRGKETLLSVVTPWTDPEGDRDGYSCRYAAAYEALKNGAPDTAARWQALRHERPDDPCVTFHCARLAVGETGTRIKPG